MRFPAACDPVREAGAAAAPMAREGWSDGAVRDRIRGMATELETIAADLYAGPPGAFVAARNARASETADAGLAAGIRALRKPSVAAWAVNVFARERAQQLGEALRLAEDLREAQADVDAATLAQLTRERRALTSRLAADAAALAEARGGRVTDATREAVRQTITAAFFDPAAAAAVASGRLVHELEPSAGSPLDLDAAVGGGAPGAPSGQAAPEDEVTARRERRKAESALRDAEQARARAERDLASADRSARDAADRASRAEVRTAALEAELATARASAEAAQAEAVASARRRSEAAERVAGARAQVDEARAALEARNGHGA